MHTTGLPCVNCVVIYDSVYNMLSLSFILVLPPPHTHSDPPVDPCNIPSGEWLCRRCRAGLVEEGVPPLFRPLVEQACIANPLIFDIPCEFQRYEVLPGIIFHSVYLLYPSRSKGAVTVFNMLLV